MRHDHVRLHGGQLLRQHRQLLGPPGGETAGHAHVALLLPSELSKSLPESREPVLHFGVSLGEVRQHADMLGTGTLLCICRER